MTAYACVQWRNFVSVAADLSFTSGMNKPFEINLDTQLLQGANPIDQAVLDDKGFQGAFYLNYYAIDSPLYGKLEPGLKGTGWRYYPNKDFVGTDTFTYVLNNGTQNSNIATVAITIQEGLSGSITVFKADGKPYWRVTGSHFIPQLVPKTTKSKIPVDPKAKPPRVYGTAGTYQMITYTWLLKRSVRTFSSGKPYIYETYANVGNSTITPDPITEQPLTTDLNATTEWFRFTWPDPNLSGYLPGTTQPYIQPDGPFPFILRIDFYDNAQFEDIKDPITRALIRKSFTYYKTHDSIEIDVVGDKGADWYANGSVLSVSSSAPDYPIGP